MKTKELIARLDELGYMTCVAKNIVEIYWYDGPEEYTVGFVDTKEVNIMDTNSEVGMNDELFNLLIEYAKTPIRDREEPTMYIVPLPYLVTTDGEQQYLTKRGNRWFASRKQKHLKQTWREGSLHEIPEEYRDYAVEVE